MYILTWRIECFFLCFCINSLNIHCRIWILTFVFVNWNKALIDILVVLNILVVNLSFDFRKLLFVHFVQYWFCLSSTLWLPFQAYHLAARNKKRNKSNNRRQERFKTSMSESRTITCGSEYERDPSETLVLCPSSGRMSLILAWGCAIFVCLMWSL